ncbi:putative odorant receptor 71a [Colletes latitarsis]|uniref:putative odorant receptor 71a n=1 Tax=Colletes latitarsis TaxID=2605962 RepID=UPI004036D957
MMNVYHMNNKFRITKATQKNKKSYATLGDLPYYGPLKKFLILIGQYPQQTNYSRISIYIVHIGTYISLLIPLLIECYTSLHNNDIDRLLEALPVLATDFITMMKLSNLNFNRKKFIMLYDLVISEWESLKFKNNVKTLDEVTRKGSNIAFLYRILVVTAIVTIDSMYMLVTYHACGLFSICGNQIKEITQSFEENNDNTTKEGALYQQFIDCALIHKRAIQFYEHINDMNELSFLIQIGVNMMAISLTAVQLTMNLNNIGEAFRIGLFLGAQQFHLLFNSLPGQSLVDHSLQLLDDLYTSKWYQAPVRMQRVIYMMQIRSGVPCTLTAGGLYDMNIENFGMIFKSCMSYFTMLLSLRE